MDGKNILKIADTQIDLENRALIMGILNRTTDSFYDKGSYFELDKFLKKAESLVESGADILDVGGVKAGPGQYISLQEELDRVVPAVIELKNRFDAYISVDTFRSKVLKESLKNGAVIANDISGLKDPEYVTVAADFNATLIITHIRLYPRVDDPNPEYVDVVQDVAGFLQKKIEYAVSNKIEFERIIIDAGLDLGKNPDQSFSLISPRAFDLLGSLGRPLLLSASYKAFLFKYLDMDVSELKWPTLVTCALSRIAGARIFRVHDAKEINDMEMVLRAICGS
jgi:dihydropteroate synthase